MPYFKALDSRDQGKLVIARRQEKWGRYHITFAPPPPLPLFLLFQTPKAKRPGGLRPLVPEDEGTAILRNFDNSLPVEGGKRFSHFQNVVTSSGAYPASCAMDTGVISRNWHGRGVKLTIDLHPIPRLRMSGALYLYSYVCLQGLDRDNLACTSRCNTPFSTSGLVVVFFFFFLNLLH